MANRLKMATVQTIFTLKKRGWSNRRIERELGIRRETVSRYIQLAQQDSKPASNAPPGSKESKPAGRPVVRRVVDLECPTRGNQNREC